MRIRLLEHIQSEPQRHGREDAKQDGEEPLAAVLRVALDRRDRCNRGADGVNAGERIYRSPQGIWSRGAHRDGGGNLGARGLPQWTPLFRRSRRFGLRSPHPAK